MAPNLQMVSLSLYMLTFNCGRAIIDIDAVASQLFSNLQSSTAPDLLVLALQEIAPVAHSFIGGSFLHPYFDRFLVSVEKAARKLASNEEGGSIYKPVAVRNVGMTGIMILAKNASAVQDVLSAGVGFGVLEMGNKGAVGVRLTYAAEGSSTEMTFIAAHLEAMEDAVKERNDNWKSITERLVFSNAAEDTQTSTTQTSEERPLLSNSSRDGSIYKPTSHLFVAGDLNYRTSTLRPAPDDYTNTFPQPHCDPFSEKHYSNLFKSDQLNQERGAGRTLHGLIESPVKFPPTYKYEQKGPFLTSDEELSTWHWAKHRWPSWCDRILYLDIPSWSKDAHPKAQIQVQGYKALPLFPTSDHRAVGLEVTIPLTAIPEPHEDEAGNDPRLRPPFDVDATWKSRRDKARALELVVGYLSYFSTTWEGGVIALATIAGAVGAYLALRAIIEM